MGPAILIAHGHPGDHLHDRAFALAPSRARVAWIGAASNDSPASFARTATVLRERYGADVAHARTVPAPDVDLAATRQLIEEADLLYLGGGDVALLAERLRVLALDEPIRRRHADGAVVVGISAGAIGLSRYWLRFPDEDDETDLRPSRFACIGAVDLAVDVHDEDSDWEELRALLDVWAADEPDAVVEAWGIPTGGALEVGPSGVTHLGPAPKRLRLDRGRIIE
jgi:hypothetical protein